MSFRDLSVSGEGNSVVINQVVQIATQEVMLRPFLGSSPYIGLSRFEERHKDFFFGRDRLVSQLLTLISAQNLLLATGASGCGKSSLVRCGFLPQLAARLPQGRFRPLIMTPDRDPYVSLRSALHATGLPQRLTEEVRSDSQVSLAETLVGLRPLDELWLLIVDQFEELFTLCADQPKRAHFIDSLVQLATAKQAEIKIVLAMRADFFDRLGAYPELGKLAERGLCLVTEMDSSELRAAIEQPAARHGVLFEAGLVDRIIADVKGRPGALPLLQFMLDLLWREDNPEDDRTLNQVTYHRIGGVEGALRQRADSLYSFSSAPKRPPRPATEQALIRTIFLRLTDFVGENTDARAVSRRTLLSEFRHQPVLALISELVEEKLLVTNAGLARGTGRGEATVEIAHEALLSSWPRLSEWLTQGREVIYVRHRLSADTARWSQARHAAMVNADEELWSGSRLQQAQEMEQRGDFQSVLGGLAAAELEFLSASASLRDRRTAEESERHELLTRMELAKQRQRNKLLVIGAGCLSVFLVITSALTIYAIQKERLATSAKNAAMVAERTATKAEKTAQAAQDAAEQRELDAYVEQGRMLLVEKGQPLEALLWLHRAYQQRARKGSLPFLLTDAVRPLDAFRGILSGAEGPVNDAAYSPDGDFVATASDDGLARIYSVEANKLSMSIAGHEGIVWSVRYSPDGRCLATAGDDKTAKLWDAGSGKPRLSLRGHTGAVRSVRFSPDGRRVLTASDDKTAIVWDADTGKSLLILHGHSETVNSASYSPNGTRIVTAGDDKLVRIWDAGAGSLLATLPVHSDAVSSASYSPDGHFIVTASWDNTARVFDVDTRRIRHTLSGHSDAVSSASYSPDGQFIVTVGLDKVALFWDAQTGDLVDRLLGPNGALNGVSYSSNGRFLVLASDDHTAWAFNSVSGRRFLSFGRNAAAQASSASYSPSGHRIVTANSDKTARVFDASTGKQLQVLSGHTDVVFSASYSPDGSRIVTSSNDKTARIFDGESGQALLTLPGHQGSVSSASYSPDGLRVITAGDDKTVRVFDAKSGQLQGPILEQEELVTSARFSPDGKRIIAVSDRENVARVYDAASGKLLVSLSGHHNNITDAIFSSDGRHIATASADRTAMIWDAAQGKPLTSLVGHRGPINAIDYSPDGRSLVTVGSDKTTRVWDSESGKLLTSLNGPAVFERVRYSPDGHHVVAVSADKKVFVLGLDREQRTAEELAQVMRCHLGIKLEGAVVVPNSQRPEDCASLRPKR